MLEVTIGCQLEIMMIIEGLIQNGFKIISVNTDGFDSIVEESRLEEYFHIIKEFEKKIDNEILGNFEYTVFDWIAQTSVSDYIAKKKGEYINGIFIPHKSKEKDDWLKCNGDFEYPKELHKNSSFSILALSYQNYFDKGIDVEDFINNHNDIFDFCARSNSGKTYLHKAYKGNGSFSLPKLIRYYVSKEGVYIKKIVKEGVDTGANDQSVQPAEKLKCVCNNLPKKDYQFHLNNLDRQWYIDKAKETIFAIENGRKPNKIKVDRNQLNLF